MINGRAMPYRHRAGDRCVRFRGPGPPRSKNDCTSSWRGRTRRYSSPMFRSWADRVTIVRARFIFPLTKFYGPPGEAGGQRRETPAHRLYIGERLAF